MDSRCRLTCLRWRCWSASSPLPLSFGELIGLGWAALILAALSLVMPRHFGGGDYADYRLIAVSLMIGAMAVDWPVHRLGFVLAALPFLVRMGVLTMAWQASARETERILTVVDHIPQGARVAGAVLIERRSWALYPLEHVTSYATVRKDALVNSHFAIPGVHMLGLRGAGPEFSYPRTGCSTAGAIRSICRTSALRRTPTTCGTLARSNPPGCRLVRA